MLLVIYDVSCEEEVRGVFRRRAVRHFSQIPKLYGQGEAGVVEGSLRSPGHNAGIFAVLPDEEAERVAQDVKDLVRRGGGCGCAPIRAFLMPCEQVV